MEKTIIEIQEIKEKIQKTGSNGQYWSVKVVDGKSGRVGLAWGDWAKDWKLGDQIEVYWKENEYNNPRTGQVQKTWKLENPNKKPYTPRTTPAGNSSGAESTSLKAWEFSSILLAPIFAKTGKINIDLVDELAKRVKLKLEAFNPAPAPVPVETPAPAAPVQTDPVVPPATPYPTPPVVEVPPAQPAAAPTQPISEDFAEDNDKPF